jgi:hypothetical protein
MGLKYNFNLIDNTLDIGNEEPVVGKLDTHT